jgi:hypothetical protein
MKGKLLVLLQLICMFILTQSCSVSDTNDGIVTSVNPSEEYSLTSECATKQIPMFGSYITVLDSAEFYKFQDDIWIPKNYVDSVDFAHTRGAAILGRSWPNNKVYYSLENVPSEYQSYILQAIRMVEQHSYIDFEPTKSPLGYLKFNYKKSDQWDAHSDYLGMKRFGTQNIVLSTEPITMVGTIVHEICHAIGMDHEQNRSDRDNYVSIDFSIMPDDNTKYQYKKYTDKGLPGADIGAFDFGSIMLYSSDKYMKKKDGSSFRGQREKLSNTDMLTLAALQPLGNDFTFYDPLEYNGGINSDYLYRRSKMLRCPEGAKICFDFMYLNDVNTKNLGRFAYDDFDITSDVRIVDADNGVTKYNATFKIENMKSWHTTPLPEITLPQGFYIVYVTLQGKVNGEQSEEKKNALKKILYGPNIYLDLKKATINGKSKNIPSEFGNDKRNLTFISI